MTEPLELGGDAILKFEIDPAASPDAEVVARALIAWVETIKAAMAVIEPGEETRIELVGVEQGSQVFIVAIKRIQDGAKEYPLIAKAAGSLATAITGALATIALTPDSRIPDDQMAVFRDMNRNIEASLAIQRRREDFYNTIYPEPAITAVEVQDAKTRKSLYVVPRGDFARGSGLFTAQPEEPAVRTENRVAIWDVVVIRPALVAKPRRWTFAREGLEFTALMDDPAVFEAMRAGTLPIPFAEGVHLKVRLEYKERREGDVWRVIPESRKVAAVLEPLPPAPSTPLFPAPGLP